MTDPYSAPPQRQGSNGLAIASLVCGIIGILVAAVVFGIAALITGYFGLQRANQGGGGRNLAIAGLVLGVVDIVLFVILLVARGNGFYV